MAITLCWETLGAGLEFAGSLPGSPAWVKLHVHGAVQCCNVLYNAVWGSRVLYGAVQWTVLHYLH